MKYLFKNEFEVYVVIENCLYIVNFIMIYNFIKEDNGVVFRCLL